MAKRAGENEHVWENIGSHIWEAVQEDDDGNLVTNSVTSLAEAIRKRRKLLSSRDYAQSSRRIIRDMIRYLYIVIDTSQSSREKDLALSPSRTRLDVVLKNTLDFIGEYYDQNPLSHLGIILLRDGEAEMLTELSGSPRTHKFALEALIRSESGTGPTTGGEMSVQNGLEIAGRSLGSMPQYGSKEILLLVGSLSTSDPGDVLCETLPTLKKANIRVSCISLVAEMYVCKRISDDTGGIMGVCLDGGHLRDLIMGQCVPPPSIMSATQDGKNNNSKGGSDTNNKYCEFVQMGFPTRESADIPGLIHATRDKKMFGMTGFICPRCRAKISELPSDCAVCGLKLVLAPHLARSFHHLFPVPAFNEIPPDFDLDKFFTEIETNALKGFSINGTEKPSASGSTSSSSKMRTEPVNDSLLITSRDCDQCCFSCLKVIPLEEKTKDGKSMKEPNLRLQCPDCLNIFCADCDAYLHETVHNCPGCLRK